MEEILAKLIQVNGIVGALIIGKDGLIIEFKGEIDTDPNFIGATIAEFFTSAEIMMRENFSFGEVDKITIETSSGKYLLNAINSDTFLVTITGSSVNLGLMRLEIKTAIENLQQVI